MKKILFAIALCAPLFLGACGGDDDEVVVFQPTTQPESSVENNDITLSPNTSKQIELTFGANEQVTYKSNND